MAHSDDGAVEFENVALDSEIRAVDSDDGTVIVSMGCGWISLVRVSRCFSYVACCSYTGEFTCFSGISFTVMVVVGDSRVVSLSDFELSSNKIITRSSELPTKIWHIYLPSVGLKCYFGAVLWFNINVVKVLKNSRGFTKWHFNAFPQHCGREEGFSKTVTVEDLNQRGEHMQQYCRDITRKEGVKRSLISSMWGKDLVLLTPLFKGTVPVFWGGWYRFNTNIIIK